MAIRSGHGVGKTAFLSWLVLWWLLTRLPTKVVCTANTAHQLSDVLWSEIGKWHRKLPEGMRRLLEIKSDKIELAGVPDSFAVARTSRREQPEALQGFHSENLLFVIDEASGVPDIVFEVGQGALSTEGAKVVMTGNPTRTTGYFYDAFNKNRKPCTAFSMPWHFLPSKQEDFAGDRQDLPKGIFGRTYLCIRI